MQVQNIQKILVSIASDDEHNYKIMTWASRLCDAVGAKIELIHVLDPKVDEQGDEMMLSPYMTYDDYFAGDELVQSDVDMAEVRMSQIRNDFGIPRENCHLIKGQTADGIVDFCEDNDIDLLVAGIRSHYGLLSSGFNSNAIKIVAHLDRPVFFVPDQAPPIKSESFHMLFASDLREASGFYLEQALGWSQSIQAKTFTAMHVVPEKSQVGRIWDGLRSLVTSDQTGALNENQEERARVKNELRQVLKQTANKLGITDGVRFGSMALEGEVCEELSRAVRRTLANVVCLGRHNFFHADDASFGKVPFRRLGEFGVPVLICREIILPQLQNLAAEQARAEVGA